MNFIDVLAVKARTGLNTGKETPKGASPSTFDLLTTENWAHDQDYASLDDFLERIPDPDKVEIPVDLPEQLSRIDVTDILPKLPILPLLPPAAYKIGDHPAAELFASQTSLDSALHTSSDQDHNGLDTLLLCHNDGSIHLILYDSLSLGNVKAPSEWKTTRLNYLQHASHPFGCSHMLLSEVPSREDVPAKIALAPLSLRFLHSGAGSQLHMIESKTAQLETLVQYVAECLLALHHHWRHANDLPSRFMEGINESLAEQQDPNLVQSLFHLSVTGDCPPTLKEWLVDILAERVSAVTSHA
jgi:anaphase-promoting complex subunit 4